MDDVREELARARIVFEHSPSGIVVCDPSNRIVDVNPAFTRITGYTIDDARGRNPRLLRSGRHPESFYRMMWDELLATGSWSGEIWNRRKDGSLYVEWLTVCVVRDDRGEIRNFIGILEDRTRWVEADQKVRFLAHHDPLTGLPNRALMYDRLGQAIERARRDDGRLAVLFADLDHFKAFNDSLGHAVGDRLLREVAARILRCVRRGDTVCRLGGDEFVVVLTEVAGRESASNCAARIMERFRLPVELDGHTLHVRLSLGIAMFPADGEDAESLIRGADAALYAAKERGRGCFQFFHPSLDAAADERERLDGDLRKSLERGALSLSFQPSIRATDGRPAGAEVFVRWDDASRGLLDPHTYATAAETSPVTRELGRWLLEASCAQIASWRAGNGPTTRLGIHLAAAQLLQSDVAEDAREVLKRYGTPPGLLELQVDEAVVSRYTDLLRPTLDGLRRLGVHLAIDGLGASALSLSRLRDLPFDRARLDRGFVERLGDSSPDTRLVGVILRLCDGLGLESVADGVETEAQRESLVELGCCVLQGNLICPPLDADALAEWLRQRDG